MRFGGLRRFSLKWWLALPFSIGDIWKRLTPKDGMLYGQSCWWHGDLPRRHVQDVFPGAGGADYRVLNPGRRDPSTSTSLFELNCILMARASIDARKVLEVGTFDGNTTLNLAVNLPEGGQIVTLDLPIEEARPELSLAAEGRERNVTDRKVVGAQFRDRPEAARIRQVLGDSGSLDWKSLGGPFDFAFIDGCHSYDYVKSDTAKALEVVRPGGLVLWHDYAEMESVSRAVDEMAGRFAECCALQGTRIAVGFVKKA